MSSYPPGGDYDERLLDNAPKATKAELQEGYNVNLLASDNSESPMNARPQPTVDEHPSLEAATPPTKEGYTSYSVPWHRQGKWRIFMLIGAIVIIGAVVGGVVGGTVGHKSNKTVSGQGPTSTVGPTAPIDATAVGPGISTSPSGPQATVSAASPGASSHPNTVIDMGAVPASIAL